MGRFIRFFMATVAGILLCVPVASAADGGCYGYLTEMVRSSDFPFRYVTKDRVNLLIDEDDGEMVRAQLFYDTDGTGTIGWVEYNVTTHVLRNTSAELEEPVALTFDAAFAKGYAQCVAKGAGA
ncbi:hypothetical protein [Pseudomonas brassicacearum]|uniref:Lipoprotein n=1 Tax=Pseudomonas brassicacearum TaxID=930166 RepID=A0A423GZZ8_9PSED|nr:hypothetical protein [Pseudomonas brassicacearum]RON03953.1 hypothetical protein BK658_03620 [Pseudomonas brassicacearum]